MRKRFTVAALALCTAAVLSVPAAASASVYWGSGATIAAAGLDGTPFAGPFMKLSFTSVQGPACGVAVNGTDLYWAGAAGVGRTNLDGIAAPTAVVRAPAACGVAVDPSYVYWALPGLGAIGRSGLDGSEPSQALVHGLDKLCAVAAANGFVYWIDGAGIGRARSDGSEPTRILDIPSRTGCALAVDGRYLYWSANNAIGRSNLDGSGVQPTFIPGLAAGVGGIALDLAHIYWVGQSTAGAPVSLGRATIAGAEPNPAWIPSVVAPAGIAVDGRTSTSPRYLPSLGFAFGKVTRNARRGTAVIEVRVPEAGTLEVRWPKLGWHVRKQQVRAWEGGSFIWRLKLWPGHGKFGREVRAQLAATGMAPINLKVAYAEEHSLPVTSTKLVVLRKLHPR